MEPVRTIIPNLGLAPRKPGCFICKNVAAVEHVTVLLIDSDGRDLPFKDAVQYLEGILGPGAKTPAQLKGSLKTHRAHVRRSMERPPAYSPLGQVTKMAPTQPPGGSPTWVRAPDRAVDLGMEAMEALQERLSMMEDADLIAVARLGITAAGKRGDWEAKGRQLGQMDALIDLAYESSLPGDD